MTNFSKTINFFKITLHLPLSLAACMGLAVLTAVPALAQVTPATASSTATTLVRPRIAARIDDSSRVALAGSRPPRAAFAADMGAVPGSTPIQGISLIFSRTPAQQSALDALVAAQQNPASPQFHQWITPEQYAAQFGVADSDIAAVETWLEQQGFTVGSVSRSRNRIRFSGTAAQVQATFGAPLHFYRPAATTGNPNPQTRFAPATDLSLPAALSSVVLAVDNLSSFRLRPHVKIAHQPARANFTSSQTGNHFLDTDDLQTIYDVTPAYNAGYTGAGQTIAIVGQSSIVPTDISNYQTAIGSAAKLPSEVLVTGSGQAAAYPGDEAESDIDLEYASTMAPGANVIFVYTGNAQNYGVFDSIAYAIDNDIAPIISTSYGECEPGLGQTVPDAQAEYTTLNNELEKAAAQGQTVIAAAGDDGSEDCYGEYTGETPTAIADNEQLAVDFPGSSQYVTSMGGSEFPAADVTASTGNTQYFAGAPGADVVSSALSYIPEQAWNDDTAEYGLSSGGGGVSIFTPRPSWQTGVPGMASSSFRLVPDLSLDSSNTDAPLAICSSDTSEWNTEANGGSPPYQESSCNSGLRDSYSQDLTIAGGTSFAAPTFAGMVAILNQAKGYTTTKGQGVVNTTLYSLASNATTYASAFHDITSGGNQCTAGTALCSTAGAANYITTTGYDEATGLGSVDFYNLLNAWPLATGYTPAANTSFTVTAANATVAPGSSANSTVTVTPANGYTGTVSFTVSASPGLTYACWTLPSATVTTASAATSTLAVTTSQASCASGSTQLMTKGSSGSSGVAANRTPSTPAPSHSPSRSPAAPLTAEMAGFLMAGVLLTGLGLRRRKSLGRLFSLGLSLTLLAALGLGAFGLSGCSSSASGSNTITTTTTTTGASTTPAGTYTITVTGVSTANSSLVSTATFTLTVS